MADISAESGVLERWRRFRDSSVAPFMAEPRVSAYVLPAAFLVLTFLVYWFAGPQKTIFTNHVNQANSLLHGHLDLLPEFSGFITEPSLYEGKADYVATRKAGKWGITELKMSANKIHIIRDKKGVWRKK